MNWWRRFLGWFAADVDDTFSPPAPLPPLPADHAADVVDLFNGHRRAAKLPPLTSDPGLAVISRHWAESMAAHDRLDHGNFAGRVGAQYPSGIVGEDIAMGQAMAEEVVADWMDSPGHRAQILSPAHRFVGVGRAVSASGDVFWCADFRS